MDSQKRSKAVKFSAAALALVPSVVAQNSVLNQQDGVQASFIQFFNTVMLFRVDSVQGVLLYFIAPMFGFYFVQKNMLNYGFELMEERIDRRSFHRRNEDIPEGIKGLSIVTSFITVEMLGTLGAQVLLGAALISILLAATMQLGLLENMGGGGGGGNRNRNTNTGGQQNTGGGQQNTGGGGTGVDWGNVTSNLGSMVSDLSDMNTGSGSGSSGGSGGPDRGIDNALDMLEKMKNKTSSGASVQDVLEQDAVDLNDAIDDAKAAVNDGEVEMNSTHDLEERIDKLVMDLVDLRDETADDNVHGVARKRRELEKNNRPLDQQAQKIVQDVNRIKEAEKSQLPHLEDEIDELKEAAELYAMILGFVGRLPKPLDEFRNDKKLQKKLIKRGMKRGVFDKPPGTSWPVKDPNVYDRFANQLSSSLGKVDSEIGDINHNLGRAEKFLEKELKITKGEINHIKASIKNIKKTGNLIDEIRNNIRSGSDLDENGNCQDIMNDLDYVENELDGVHSELRQLETRMKGDTEYESEMAEKLRDIYQK